MRRWIGNWIASWLDMICGLISVVTLCLWRPWWDFQFRAWWDKREMKRGGLLDGGRKWSRL